MNPLVEYLKNIYIDMNIKFIILFICTFVLSYILIRAISLNKLASKILINLK